jgi:hypothetical protein
MFQDIGQRYTVDDADGNLPDNSGLDYLCGDPFCKRKEKEERNNDEDFDNWD